MSTRFFSALFLSVWVGCAGKLEHPERFDFLLEGSGLDAGGPVLHVDPPPACVTTFFEKKCGSSICHGAGADQVDLVSPGVERRLVHKKASDDLSCGGRTLVTTDGSPSLLVEKLSDDPSCGFKMPLSGTASDDEIACVSGWVDSLSAGEDGGR